VEPDSSESTALGWHFYVLLLAILLLGCYWRFTNLSVWPPDYYEMRQYHSAIVARALWLKARPTPPNAKEQRWLKAAAERPDSMAANLVEPPLTELLVLGVYLLTGHEQPWISGLFTSLFWMAGGWFIFEVGRRLGGDPYGGLLSLGFYVLTPAGILLSRAFQPEALMILAFTAALWFLVRRGLPDSWPAVVTGGLICGLCVLVKPGFAFFPLAGAYAAMAWQRDGFAGALRNEKHYAFGVLMALPSLVYAVLFLSSHARAKVMPELLLASDFYWQYGRMIDTSVGWFALASAVAGACLMLAVHRFPIGWGLLAGYLAYTAFYTYHSMTHHYYQAPLVVVVAICLSPLATMLRRGLSNSEIPRRFTVALCCVLLLGYTMVDYDKGQRRREFLQERARKAVELSERLGDEARVIAVNASDYGTPLIYHGMMIVEPWPNVLEFRQRALAGNPVEPPEEFQKLLRDFSPTHVVFTDDEEARRQIDFVKYLESNYEPAVEAGYLTFDLRRRRGN